MAAGVPWISLHASQTYKTAMTFLKPRGSWARMTLSYKGYLDAQLVCVLQCKRMRIGCFMRNSVSLLQGKQPLLYSN
jgi:hypothetical protein